jgi:predicted  nucleic acid-binding Zn-ribbon protein
MSDQPDNILLIYMRRLDQKLDRLVDDVSDLKLRVSGVEAEIGRLRVDIAGVNSRLDRLEHRIDLLDRRQDTGEAFHRA